MMKGKGARIFSVFFLTLFLFALAGCVSVEKRFEKGKELERAGRFEEAANLYIKVLKKDPAWQEARERLKNVGARAVDVYLEHVNSYRATGAFEDAVRALGRLDDLRNRATGVGVLLQVPDGYEGLKREMVEAAVGSLFKQAELAEQAGNWPEAINKYERLYSYPLSSGQRQKADLARARGYSDWAEQDLAGNSFRAGFDHAQKAIDILGPDSAMGSVALRIQKAALDRGTRTAAVLPLWISEKAEGRTPRDIVKEVYDVLMYEHLSQPVPFVAVADPGSVHRELRRLNLKKDRITRSVAAGVGRNLNTDFVVIGWLESYFREEKILEQKEHTVRLKSDPASSVVFLEQKYSLELTAELRFEIVDSLSRRLADEQTVRSEVREDFRRGVYDGDYARLELSSSQHRLFDREERHREEQELVNKLIDKLAGRLAQGINERVLRFVR